MSWFAFIAKEPVPVFDWVDLGFHELGHMITYPFPDLVTAMAGSVLQIAVPAGLALYFWLRQQDRAATGFCMAWAGTSAWDVSVYVADAPIQALPLLGGGQHDWAYILGWQQFDVLDRAGAIAGFIETLGMAAAVAGIGIALWPAAAFALKPSSGRDEPTEQPARPIRETIYEPGQVPASSTSAVTGADPWLEAAQMPFFHDDKPQ
jgi:hypothetical protein